MQPSDKLGAAMLGIALAVSSAATAAADADGQFMVKGAGIATCERFVAARSGDPVELASFAGWMDGYLSAMNRFQSETYDIAPWQSSALLVSALTGYCTRNPEQNFHKAVAGLAVSLQGERLRQRSEVVEARAGDASLLLYSHTLERAQRALVERGLLEGAASGVFDEHTEAALRAFQRDAGMEETGLPDQLTLARLLS